MGEDGSWVLVAIALAIMHIDLAIQDRRDFKRRKKEEADRLKRIMEIMRDPNWRESMRQVYEAHRPNPPPQPPSAHQEHRRS